MVFRIPSRTWGSSTSAPRHLSEGGRAQLDCRIEPDPISAWLEYLELRCQITRECCLQNEAESLWPDATPTFHFVVEGSCLAVAEDLRQVLSVGDLLLIFEGRSHRLMLSPGQDAAATCRTLSGTICSVRDDWTTLLKGQPKWHLVKHEDVSRDWLTSILHVLVQELQCDQEGAWAIVNQMFSLAVCQIARLCLYQAPAEHGCWLGGLRDPDLGPILTRMLRDPGAPWTIASLAETGQMARSTFARRFRQVVGEAPMDFLTTIRMHLACEFLRSELGIKEVARRIGYRSVSAFSVAFRRKYGMSPMQYRAEC